ncbi:MAG: translation elongation factor 4 [Chloroflexi bacterium]|nr:translation elongation factor 4 [Chloroflexota bacterium]
MDPSRIRNYCIIAHIDHGKSTLADRMLEITGTVTAREMQEQLLDSMDIERERGITIKAQAVRMSFTHRDGVEYEFNLIDTPGHVDFAYEVSRSLAACEGAILVVDATQGIQAQTLANVYMALDHDLAIIPVVNKIDLPMADAPRVIEEMRSAFGFSVDEVLAVSAKAGTGVRELLEAVVDRVPAPEADSELPLRALVFDCKYDSYKGVLAYVRVMDGTVRATDRIRMMATDTQAEVLEVGAFNPTMVKVPTLEAGEVGYIATGLKSVGECRVGDTITTMRHGATDALPGYGGQKPMVFAGLYPTEGVDFHDLREALERLEMNDAAFVWEPESSDALGPGFRCGFLGLLHMEIVQERLEREYGMDLVVTAPSVVYQVVMHNGSTIEVSRPTDLPNPGTFERIEEPWLDVSILTPSRYIGPMMELINSRRGEFKRTEYLDVSGLKAAGTDSVPSSDPRVVLEAAIPMGEVVVDFYDQVKTRSRGYASLDYTFTGFRAAPLVRLDILVNAQPVDALSLITHREDAFRQGRSLVEQLRKLIPRQMFDVAIQAAIGGKIVARETVQALRKNVIAKCYGGDITRKRKLLEKQAEGKKRMKRIGRVEVPQEAFLAVLKMDR